MPNLARLSAWLKSRWAHTRLGGQMRRNAMQQLNTLGFETVNPPFAYEILGIVAVMVVIIVTNLLA